MPFNGHHSTVSECARRPNPVSFYFREIIVHVTVRALISNAVWIGIYQTVFNR